MLAMYRDVHDGYAEFAYRMCDIRPRPLQAHASHAHFFLPFLKPRPAAPAPLPAPLRLPPVSFLLFFFPLDGRIVKNESIRCCVAAPGKSTKHSGAATRRQRG